MTTGRKWRISSQKAGNTPPLAIKRHPLQALPLNIILELEGRSCRRSTDELCPREDLKDTETDGHAQTSLASIRELPWKRFEDLLGEAFRRQGFKVEETLGGGADGGIDLLLGRDGNVTVVQCKRRNGAPVGVREVRELYGVLHHRGASAAKLVATTSFTPDAVAFAKGKPIELVDSNALLHLIRNVQTSGKMIAPPAQMLSSKCGMETLREADHYGWISSVRYLGAKS